MTHSLSTLLLLALFFLPFISSTTNTTVYEILNMYSLPSGLLPDSVTSYEFDSDTGRFTVYLAKPCYIQFEYLVYYDKKVTGSLGFGSITDLDGIEVKKFFLWLDVKEIKVDLPPNDSIYFQVGFINKELDIKQFETVHTCKDNGLGCSSLLKMPTPSREVPALLTE